MLKRHTFVIAVNMFKIFIANLNMTLETHLNVNKFKGK